MSNPIIKSQLSATSTSYNSSDGVVENLNTARFSTSLPLLSGATLSTDFGVDTSFNVRDVNNTYSVNPAFELKYKQNFTDNIRSYVRYRHIGQTDQVRVAAGYNKEINDNLALYADGHYTFKFADSTCKKNFGAWIGTDYKLSKHFSVWGEIQKNFSHQNPNFNGFDEGQWMLNIGCNYKF